MTTLIYAAIAIAFLILVIGFLRKPLLDDPDEALTQKSYAPCVSNGRWLDLSERIFDPSDARWLAEELAFPKLAEGLDIGAQALSDPLAESLAGLVRRGGANTRNRSRS